MTIDWDNPAERLALIERVGPDEYRQLLEEHLNDVTIETVGGHKIRPVNSRYGRLYTVGTTGRAFATLLEAQVFALQNRASRKHHHMTLPADPIHTETWDEVTSALRALLYEIDRAKGLRVSPNGILDPMHPICIQAENAKAALDGCNR